MDFADIKQAFKDNGVDLYKEDTWKVQAAHVIKHSALERLGAALKIKWEKPTVVRAERDEAVVLVEAGRPDVGAYEWSFGEAMIVSDKQIGGNYKVSGKQAAYIWAMAEKRAKDRVIIKLAGLHGAYSSEEADDFKDPAEKEYEDEPAKPARTGKPASEGRAKAARQAKPEPEPKVEAPADSDSAFDIMEGLKRGVDQCKTVQAVIDLMGSENSKERLDRLSDEDYEAMRKYGRARIKDLQEAEKAKREQMSRDELGHDDDEDVAV
jgi:hypothetical protein